MFRGLFRLTSFLQKRVPFLLADIGEGISEVQIIQWYVKEGSVIKQFEKIAEVQSDKATVEITSRYDGIVKKIHYNLNEMAKVGEALIDIETPESEVEKESVENTETLESGSSGTGKEKPEIHGQISNDTVNSKEFIMMPSVRKFVKEKQIDLSKLNLTNLKKEKGDVITKEDILKAIECEKTQNDLDSYYFVEYQMNPIQKSMARVMQESLKIPHFGYCDEYRMDAVIKYREEINAKSKVKISILPIIINAISKAVKEFPTINAHYIDGKLFTSSILNLGIAVDTPQGLVVPVLKNLTEAMNPEIINEKLNDLSDRARRNKLSKEDFEGATLTISNIGTIGGTYTNPVIVSPQVCIVAIGKIRKLPYFNENGAIQPQQMACFSWSADHRAIDGATLARFSNRIKELLDNVNENVIDNVND